MDDVGLEMVAIVGFHSVAKNLRAVEMGNIVRVWSKVVFAYFRSVLEYLHHEPKCIRDGRVGAKGADKRLVDHSHPSWI